MTFKVGELVRVRPGVCYETCRDDGPSFTEEMDELRDEVLTVTGVPGDEWHYVRAAGWSWAPKWLVPYRPCPRRGQAPLGGDTCDK